MKNIIINIPVKDIVTPIYSNSAHAARSREAMGIPQALADAMVITADEQKTIEPLIEKSINEAATIAGQYFTNCTHSIVSSGYETESISLILSVPTHYPNSCIERLKNCINEYIVDRTTQLWYLNVKPDEAAIVATKLQEQIANMKILLSMREKPKRSSDEIIQL